MNRLSEYEMSGLATRVILGQAQIHFTKSNERILVLMAALTKRTEKLKRMIQGDEN